MGDVRSVRQHSHNSWPSHVDPIAVERAVVGDHPKPRLVTDEIQEAVVILRRRGLSQTEIARRIGCCLRTVQRHVARLREAA